MNPLSKLILHKVEIEKQKAKMDQRFSLFCAKFSEDFFKSTTKYEDLNFFYKMIKSNDRLCNLFMSEGMQIDKIANSGRAFVHRTYLGIDQNENGVPKNEDLLNIMTTGLRNNGHLNAAGGSAITTYLPPLSLTMTPLNGITGYINLLSPFKGNDTVIIASFPEFLVTEEGRPTTTYSDIYDMEGNVPSIKPEFIKGALVKKNDGMWHYYSKGELTNQLNNTEKKGRNI